MTETQKKYLVSSLITFGSGFIIALVPFLDSLTVESFENGAIFAILLTAFRAGLKALAELWLTPKPSRKKK